MSIEVLNLSADEAINFSSLNLIGHKDPFGLTLHLGQSLHRAKANLVFGFLSLTCIQKSMPVLCTWKPVGQFSTSIFSCRAHECSI